MYHPDFMKIYLDLLPCSFCLLFLFSCLFLEAEPSDGGALGTGTSGTSIRTTAHFINPRKLLYEACLGGSRDLVDLADKFTGLLP